MQNAEWLCSWCPWVISSSHYWAQSGVCSLLWKLPAVRSAQIPGETSSKDKGLSLPSSLLKAPAKSRQQTWGPQGKMSGRYKKNHKQWEIKFMAKGQVKRFSTWSTWHSLQKRGPHHKTVISFPQQLKMVEFSGIYFSTLNAKASGVRSDKSHTASFPQHLTSPPKHKCPHWNSGCLLERPPRSAREGLKAQNSTTRVVLAARHQVAGCCVFKERHRGLFFWKRGKTSAMKLWFLWGCCSRTCSFSTSAAQPWVNQTTDVSKEHKRGFCKAKQQDASFSLLCFMSNASSHFHDAWIRLQGVAGPPCSRIHLGLLLPSEPQPPMSFPDLFYPNSHNTECSHSHGINNFPFNPANILHILW